MAPPRSLRGFENHDPLHPTTSIMDLSIWVRSKLLLFLSPCDFWSYLLLQHSLAQPDWYNPLYTKSPMWTFSLYICCEGKGLHFMLGPILIQTLLNHSKRQRKEQKHSEDKRWHPNKPCHTLAIHRNPQKFGLSQTVKWMFRQRSSLMTLQIKESTCNVGDMGMWIQSLGLSMSGEDPLEKGMSTHSSVLAWRIPWTEEPGGL